jgi:acyl carrier protein
MTNETLRNIVTSKITAIDGRTNLTDDSKIMGEMDSIDLVSLIIDIEDELRDNGIKVKLVSDKAFARNSPFSTLKTLINYIEELTCEKPM